LKLGEDILKNPTQFSKDYISNRHLQQEKWAQYFIENGVGASLILTDQFTSLIRKGISDNCRGISK
jgi:predicted lactoylglutathione lyase